MTNNERINHDISQSLEPIDVDAYEISMGRWSPLRCWVNQRWGDSSLKSKWVAIDWLCGEACMRLLDLMPDPMLCKKQHGGPIEWLCDPSMPDSFSWSHGATRQLAIVRAYCAWKEIAL